jgi:hypothetical protein
MYDAHGRCVAQELWRRDRLQAGLKTGLINPLGSCDMGLKKDENLSRLSATNLEHVLIRAIESEFPSDGALLANQHEIMSALRLVLDICCVAFNKKGRFEYIFTGPIKKPGEYE